MNGVFTGDNDSTYVNSSLQNNDVVSCMVTIQDPDLICVTSFTAASNNIVMNVSGAVTPSVSIKVSDNTICSGDAVTFTAEAINAGDNPSYQWQLNGNNVSNNLTYATNSLVNNDVISFVLTSSAGCTSPVSSVNKITMTVYPLPVITMRKDTIIPSGTSMQLNPSVTGNIAMVTWSPAVSLSNTATLNPVAKPENTTTYKLDVPTAEGCKASATTTIAIFTTLAMPNAFTPNGDGTNDVFRIPPSMQSEIKHFTIFNRWGNKVFTSANSARGWDGTIKGVPVPAGAYIWMIEYKDLQRGVFVVEKGTVVLIR